MAAFGFALDLTRRRGAAPARPPLDGFAGQLFAAFGLTRLLTGYAGPGVRVRRSSDGAELDIGFTGAGALDTASLLAFAGAGSAYATSWYDQSGQGRHALQTIAAAQPRLVSAGVLDSGPNGRPVLVFDGANDCLRIQDAASFSQEVNQTTVAVVVNATNAALAPWPFCDVFSGTSVRSGISLVGGSARVSGRRTGVSALTHIGGAWTEGWRALTGRIDYLAATADITVDGVTTAAEFLPPGGPSYSGASVDPPTIGAANVIGFMAGQMSAVAMARDALDGTALDAALNEVRP